MTSVTSPVEPTVAIGELLYRHIGLPYAEAPHGAAWREQVLETTALYQKVQLLRQGQVDFCAPPPGLSGEDLVLLYGCHYMQAHIAASCYGLSQLERLGWQHLGGVLEDVVIDLGCGPLTFGLALMAHQSYRDRGLGALRYLGIDQAPAMRRKAKAIATDLQALYPHSHFAFYRQWCDVLPYSGSGRLIVNCAHVLHNPSVNFQTLWRLLQRLLDREWVFIYQGPNVPQRQHKWQCLKQLLLEYAPQTEATVARIPYFAYDLQQPGRFSLRSPVTVFSEVLIKPAH